MLPIRIFSVLFVILAFHLLVIAQAQPTGNLALRARISASSSSQDTRPENLNDGDIAHTQWNPKDGTNPGDTWVELNWPTAIQFQEVVIRQEGDQKLSHVNLEIRDGTGRWRPLQSIGDSQHRPPRIILAQFDRQTASGIRISDFEGDVSLKEIYDRRDPSEIEVASDLLNHIFGVVTDAFGSKPFVNAPVELQGTAGGKPWQAAVRTDESGMFQIEMPVGLEGAIKANAHLSNGETPSRTLQAGDLSPGLSLKDDSAPQLNLDGSWRFKPDPAPGFFHPDFSDSDWKTITVPSHWMMEGFDSPNGVGGYRRHLQIPSSFKGRRLKLLFEGVYSGAEVWLNGQRIGSHGCDECSVRWRRQSASRVGSRRHDLFAP